MILASLAIAANRTQRRGLAPSLRRAPARKPLPGACPPRYHHVDEFPLTVS
jgi:hypothetical protein